MDLTYGFKTRPCATGIVKPRSRRAA